MRFWSLHPRYLDRMGLLGLWREIILAKRLLWGDEVSSAAKRYLKHPQFLRFVRRGSAGTIDILDKYRLVAYAKFIFEEGIKRGYKFNSELIVNHWGESKNFCTIRQISGLHKLDISTDQLIFELDLLKRRIELRDPVWYKDCQALQDIIPEPNPIFEIVWGPKEAWEKTKNNP